MPRLIRLLSILLASLLPLLFPLHDAAAQTAASCAPGLTLYGAWAGGFCCQGTVSSGGGNCDGTVCALDPARTQGNSMCPPPNACAGNGSMYGVNVGGFCCAGTVARTGGTCSAPETVCALDASRAQGLGLCKPFTVTQGKAVNCNGACSITQGPGCDGSVAGQCSFPKARAEALCLAHPQCKAVTCNGARSDCQARDGTEAKALADWQGFESHVLKDISPSSTTAPSASSGECSSLTCAASYVSAFTRTHGATRKDRPLAFLKCPSGQFFDYYPDPGLVGQGYCYSCAGDTRTLSAVYASDACSVTGCSSPAFHDPRNGGECWSCPSGYNRTAFTSVKDSNACRVPQTPSCSTLFASIKDLIPKPQNFAGGVAYGAAGCGTEVLEGATCVLPNMVEDLLNMTPAKPSRICDGANLPMGVKQLCDVAVESIGGVEKLLTCVENSGSGISASGAFKLSLGVCHAMGEVGMTVGVSKALKTQLKGKSASVDKLLKLLDSDLAKAGIATQTAWVQSLKTCVQAL